MDERGSAERFMKLVLRLAAKRRGRTSPNPMVGAVIVKNGVIAGKGYHKKAGEPHAEINALTAAGAKSKGADLYINLEPCSHVGRTPPCADALIKAGIRQVFVAMEDPNPQVAGSGIKRLKAAGIKVETGLLEEEARRLNEAFVKWITTGTPFVTLKAAASLDGRIATRSGDSKWITGEAARRHVHRMRDRTDAILVGIGTVEKDNPSLTARLPRGKGKDPLRVVLDSELRIPLTAKAINSDSSAPLLVATTEKADKRKAKELEKRGVEVLSFKSIKGRVPLRPLMMELGSREVTSLLVEGGSEVHASALNEGIADKLALFYAPKIIGGREAVGIVGGAGANALSEAIEIEEMTTRSVGEDILVEGYLKRN